MEIFKVPHNNLTQKLPSYNYAEFAKDLVSAVEIGKKVLTIRHCAGLTANQVGILKRFFVMRTGPQNVRYCFDPKIHTHGRDIQMAVEGCMSIPGKFVKVPRWRVITVTFIDETGKLTTTTMKGQDARIFQHECDLLDNLFIIKVESEVSEMEIIK